jgi:hypothetical protein
MPKRPSHIRVNGLIYRVDDYRVQPGDSGMLDVEILGYSQERDESVTLQLAMPPSEDDPTEPRWPDEEPGKNR